MMNKKMIVLVLMLLIPLLISTASAFVFNGKYNEVSANYGELSVEYDGKTTAYNVLQNEHQTLQGDYQTLQNSQRILQGQYNGLDETFNKCRTAYATLNEEYKKLTGRYYALEGQLDEYTVRYGEGSDCEKFITPDSILVKQTTVQALGHPLDSDCTISEMWNDMRTICQWVGANIEYNYDTYNGDQQESYQYPAETLTSKRGDCEDHAVLMVSMCKAEKSSLAMWCADVSYVKSDGKTACHELVFENVEGDSLYIFDPTPSNGWHSSASMSEPLAIQEYEQHFDCSQFTVLKLFNENSYKDFNNNQAFFNWL